MKGDASDAVWIVVPAYNAAWCVARAIDSVLAQTARDFELIVVNDGSTDDTATVLAGYGDRIRVVTQQNAGLSAARNAGIAAATLDGTVPAYREARAMDDQTLIERLTRLRGIGRWTVEMLLIYTLERADILPADDFGVRDGYRRLKGLSDAPKPRAMSELGAAWSPHRTAAAWYLW